jgi:hypothetical protein
MPFRLRKDAKDWFKGISDDFSLDFDIFYFCLMAGLATRRKAFPSANEATDLAQDFPGEYRSRGRIIVALLLTRELQELGVKFEERATLRKFEVRGWVRPWGWWRKGVDCHRDQ